MFERYTERARRALFFARYEASRFGSVSIEPDHLLLGVVREGKGLTDRLFASVRMSFESIRREIEARTEVREKVATSVEMPFGPLTKQVLEYAADEADRLRHNYIGTEHLLLALLREGTSAAAKTLTAHALTLDNVRSHLVQVLNPTVGTSGISAAEQVDSIRQLVEKVATTQINNPQVSELVARIRRDLDDLKSHLE